MLCPICHIPMKTKPGSESGLWQDNSYATAETKVCPGCGVEVRESYTAEILTEGSIATKEIKLN